MKQNPPGEELQVLGGHEGGPRPNMEIERKYLLASKEDADRLEAKIRLLFPDTRLITDCSETSYYYPRTTMQEAWRLCALVYHDRDDRDELLSRVEQIPRDTPVAIRFRKRESSEGSTFTLTVKASANPLHDAVRIEIETDSVSEAYKGAPLKRGDEPESIWHSLRRVYDVGDGTKVDVETVSGYGWKAEIEAGDLARVTEVAERLGLEPLSTELLDAMYQQYTDRWKDYYNGGEGRHFSDEDWRAIETKVGQSAVRNVIS